MVRFMVVSFLLMGMGFYELSGGSDFEPGSWRSPPAPALGKDAMAEAAPQGSQTANEPATSQRTVSVAQAMQAAHLPSRQHPVGLVGKAIPTPAAERIILRPAPSLAAEAQVPENIGAPVTTTVTRASLSFEINTDFRRVTGNRVNMRDGPGTQYAVVGKLVRDNEVEVLQDLGSGWVKLQVLETGQIAWMSASLLTKPKT